MAEGNWGSAGMHKVDIRNDLMFSYVMRNPEICTELLEVLLPGHKIARVEYIELESERDGAPQAAITKTRKNRPDTQKALLSAIDKRGVRLDAYLDDGKTIYNIEMQTAEYGALPQRARLYQAHIDINQLERGQNFDELRPSYVIFICTFDPFGQSRYQYSFRNVCRETGKELQDEAYKLFFNTTGTEGEISPSLREMLQYINNPGAYPVQKSKVELIHQIETAVEEANQDEEWRRMYMTWQIRQREAELLGEKRGIAIGEERGEKRGIAIGEKRGIAIGEKRGEERGEKRGIAIGEERGEKRGIAIGEERGEKRGIAIGEERGIAIGKELGEKRGKLETARAMLKELPLDQVARFTGLSREELQSLAGEIAPQG